MYFYSLESDCQDRDLGLSIAPIDLMKVAEQQGTVIDENMRTTLNVSILTSVNPLKLHEASLEKEVLVDYTEKNLSEGQLSKLVNVADKRKQEKVTQEIVSKSTLLNTMVISLVKSEEKKNPLIAKIDALFSDFVGMAHLKEEVTRQASFIKIQQMRKAKKIAVAASPSRHMVFKGNPGTGKTTLARIIADVYFELGVLKTNNVVETDRSGLIAEYLGQTAVKTKELIDSAIGGVLFIDEAYSLTEYANDYGSEAIDTLVKMMEDHRDDLVVIVAGYGDEMDRFVASNPGLQSRFNRYMDFPDYSEEELWEILLKLCKANSYIIQDQALLKPSLLLEFELQKQQQGKHFGNARYIRNLFERAIESQSYRLIQSSITDSVSLQSLKYCDFFSEA